MKSQCWIWNVSTVNKNYLIKQLKVEQLLGQECGYNKKINLHYLKAKKRENLIKEEWYTWDSCKFMIIGIKKDDLIVIKNIPNYDYFTIVKVVGEYKFKLTSNKNNLNHFLPIEIVGEFYKYSKIVPSSFLRTLNRELHPIHMTRNYQCQNVKYLASQVKKNPKITKKSANFIVQLWKWEVEHLGIIGAIFLLIIAFFEVASAIEGAVVDFEKFVNILRYW
ncbi:hypothetical protein QUF74_16470 [Candidatus Halobeggiatoa sp. HSG11]|nr:hypothetical protein [Candidatus Halobeggiatoa sp. HSG11]